jgi:hypothetical protein
MTQNGGSALAGSRPALISVSVMTPIVFCASLVPWASATIRPGDDLAELEALRDGAHRGASDDPVGEVGGGQRDDPGDERRQRHGQQHLAEQART